LRKISQRALSRLDIHRQLNLLSARSSSYLAGFQLTTNRRRSAPGTGTTSFFIPFDPFLLKRLKIVVDERERDAVAAKYFFVFRHQGHVLRVYIETCFIVVPPA
jgi:hypothetical protein